MLTNTRTQKGKEQRLDVIDKKLITVEYEPFPHAIVDNFFKKDFYRDLCNIFSQTLSEGFSEKSEKNKFSRLQGYDAYVFTPIPSLEYPLGLFYSIEWEQFITNLFGVISSHDAAVHFHHHKINSESGFVHNDYALCSFTEDRLQNGINPWYFQCTYTDSSEDRQPHTFKRMRSVVLMYYLNNHSWREGDGGETALYRTIDQKSITKEVAPIDNRLLVFEITPRSFHSFLENKKNGRNTIIQWFHENPVTKIGRHGNTPPVSWE